MRIMQTQDQILGFEYQVYRKDSSIIWVSESVRAIRDINGKILYYEGSVVDISERSGLKSNVNAFKIRKFGRDNS